MYLKTRYGHTDESILKLGLHDRQIYITIGYIFKNPISVKQKYLGNFWRMYLKIRYGHSVESSTLKLALAFMTN